MYTTHKRREHPYPHPLHKWNMVKMHSIKARRQLVWLPLAHWDYSGSHGLNTYSIFSSRRKIYSSKSQANYVAVQFHFSRGNSDCTNRVKGHEMPRIKKENQIKSSLCKTFVKKEERERKKSRTSFNFQIWSQNTGSQNAKKKNLLCKKAFKNQGVS